MIIDADLKAWLNDRAAHRRCEAEAHAFGGDWGATAPHADFDAAMAALPADASAETVTAAAQALLADDMIQNLRPAKNLEMTTVWVDNGSERGNHGFEHGVADHVIGDVADWLETILGTTE